MRPITGILAALAVGASCTAFGGDQTIGSLRDFCSSEMKYVGFELKRSACIRIKALGGGGDENWSSKGEKLFAYGWILNAETREPVWKMEASKTKKTKGFREFDGTITLDAGTYEAYFTVPVFAMKSWMSSMNVNVDHRHQPLFESNGAKGFWGSIAKWWTDDIADEWKERCSAYGMEISVCEGDARSVVTFTPPLKDPTAVLRATGLGDNAYVAKAFTLSEETDLEIRAMGEGFPKKECHDCGWIVDMRSRKRVWDMSTGHAQHAGGADKNFLAVEELTLPAGSYVAYYTTDDSHSPSDWNALPPYDPLHWGLTISIRDESQRKNFMLTDYKEDRNVIVSITKVRDDEKKTVGFSLKKETPLRIYAIGERSNSNREMADYAYILDARTREKVWLMDVDRTDHAGGASKNRVIDEIVTLPAGDYLLTYITDDSHAYGDWNLNPPFDQEHYGVTIMGVGSGFKPEYAAKFMPQQDKNIVAQIAKPGDDEDRTVKFTLDKTTRVRVYAIGEGQNREMYDYGWIEEARTGAVVWEMTYSMTFHAGGGRKNRSVNTTIMLDHGTYLLRWRSDDSHSADDWNVDPPDDAGFWGITIFRDPGPDAARAPLPPEAGEHPRVPQPDRYPVPPTPAPPRP